MAPIPVDVVHSWTDTLAAWASFGTAVAAVLGLGVTIWLSHTDRQIRRAERKRQERIPQLMTVNEQFAVYRAASRLGQPDEQARAEEKLKSVLALLPPGMARMWKRQFGLTLVPTDEQYLQTRFPGGVPEPFTEEALMAELQSNFTNAGYGNQSTRARRRFGRSNGSVGC